MKAHEALDKLADKGDFYHAYIGQHSVNLRSWEKGNIYAPEYSEIIKDARDYSSAVVLEAAESSSIRHTITLS